MAVFSTCQPRLTLLPRSRHRAQDKSADVLSEGLQDVATPAGQCSQTTDLIDLPEELIDEIIGYLTASQLRQLRKSVLPCLASLSLVCHKLHRIVEPHLYRSVPVLLNKLERVLVVRLRHQDGSVTTHKCDIPTTKGSNAGALLRTLQARPELAAHTKNLWLLRCDRGYALRKNLGWYGLKSNSDWHSRLRLTSAPLDLAKLSTNTELPYRVWGPIKRAALPLEQREVMEPMSVILRNILRILPNVVYLDRTKYFTDVPWDVSLDLAMRASMHALPGEHVPFVHLREVRMCCGTTGKWSALWPLFTLPALRTLALSGGVNDPASPFGIFHWKGIQSSLESIEIEVNESHFLYDYPEHDICDPLYLIATACDKLQGLSLITTNSERVTILILIRGFKQRIDNLRSVVLYDWSARPLWYADDELDAYVQRAVDQIRSAASLRTLTIDATELIYPIAEDEVNADTRGVLYDLVYPSFDDPTAGFRLFVKLELPRSLVSLQLRINGEKDQQIAVVDALRGLLDNMHERFPDLKEVELVWHDSTWYPGAAVYQLVMIPFEKLGIEVTEEFLWTPKWNRRIYVDRRIESGFGATVPRQG